MLSFMAFIHSGLSHHLIRSALVTTGLAAGLAFCTLALMPTGAHAQATADPEIRSLMTKIERLQRDMNTLQRQVYRGGGAPASTAPATVGAGGEPNLATAMQVRLDEIESLMRAFTGRLEEANHAVGGLSKKLEVLTSDIDLRLKALEARGGLPGSSAVTGSLPSGPPPATAAPSQPGVLGAISLKDLEKKGVPQTPLAPLKGDPKTQSGQAVPPAAAILPKGTPESQYRFATAFLAKSDWVGAERALNAFLGAHPKDKLAGNAQYWLGESHYVRGDYNNAALAFAKGYKDYPKSAKGPDNLLKLGLSLSNLKKTKSACVTFARVGKDFPSAGKAIKSRVKAEREKLGCR
jgi:tol-pal system protein YbgF